VRVLWIGCSLGGILYSILVLTHVARMGTIGVHCMFGTKIEEDIPADYDWRVDRPRKGDQLLAVGNFTISEGSYADYIRALRDLSDQIGKTIEVRWRDGETRAIHSAQVVVRYPPAWTYFWSWV